MVIGLSGKILMELAVAKITDKPSLVDVFPLKWRQAWPVPVQRSTRPCLANPNAKVFVLSAELGGERRIAV